MGKECETVAAMNIASALATKRGWDHNVTSDHCMFLVLPSGQSRFGYGADFLFSPDYAACTMTLRRENEMIAERIGEVQKVIVSANIVVAPARFSLIACSTR